MRRICFALLGMTVGFSACDKSTATATPPEAAEPAPAGDDATASAPAPPPGAGVVPAPAEAPPVEEPAPAEAPVAAETGEPEDPDPPAPTVAPPAAPEAPAKVAALPKPIFKNVKKSCGKDGHVGKKLKPFKLQNTKGKAVGNRSFGRRVLLVNFWGTWCKPCLKELPEFDRLQRRYRKHGLTVVAIATDEDLEPVQEVIDSKKLRSKVLLGGEDYAGKYGAPNFPFSFVVDPSGTIVGGYYNYKPECMGKLEDDIRKQLEKRNSK